MQNKDMMEGRANTPLRIFDWDKAAQLLATHGAVEAYAGLNGDWNWTAGQILTDGKPETDHYTYLASWWATPQIEIDGNRYDCFVEESETCTWDAETKWPESALAILEAAQNSSK
jgi:hypothetical protein